MRAGSPRRRLHWLLALSALALLGVVARVAWLQTVGRDSLVAAGKAQRVSKTVLSAHRGTIFARDGGELALSVPASTIYADPKFVVDPTKTAATLAAILGLDAEKEQKLITSLSSKQKRFVYVMRQIDDQLADTVMALELPGVQRLREDKRIMPSGDVGRSVLGRTVDGKTGMEGITGIEAQYNAMLTGVDGEQVRERDPQGRSIPGADATTKEPTPGQDLILTIDRSLQFQVEQALVARVDQVKGKGGTVVVMDTATGEIYANANVQRGDDEVVRVTSANLAAVEAFEPGSVAKVFSLASVVDQGAANPDTNVAVPGAKVFYEGTQWEQTIRDAEPHATEMMSMRDILVHSSNLGTYLLASKVSPSVLHDYLKRFGFGTRTALNFPDETKGILDDSSKWQGTENVTVTYGYHYQASSLQFVAAVNAIANGGTYIEPRMLKATIGADGQVVDAPPSSSHPVMAPATAATMASMMKDVVCRGTGTAARLTGISVAGKTGTAYKVIKGSYGADGARAYRASFVGFFPAEAPKLTILVTIDEPDPTSDDRFGGTAAAPLFARVATSAIHDLKITPTPGDTGCPAKG